MNEYTVFALNSDNEHFGDALFVGSEHLGAAVDALIEYWMAEHIQPGPGPLPPRRRMGTIAFADGSHGGSARDKASTN